MKRAGIVFLPLLISTATGLGVATLVFSHAAQPSGTLVPFFTPTELVCYCATLLPSPTLTTVPLATVPPTNTPRATEFPTPTQEVWMTSTPTLMPAPIIYRVTAPAGVNVRAAPALTAARVGGLIQNERVTIGNAFVSGAQHWGQISEGRYAGAWVMLYDNTQTLLIKV